MTPNASNSQDAGLQTLRRTGSVMERTARGTGWVIFWRFANRGLGLISTLFLVRLLSPADFGVVALAMSFTQGLQQLAELGTENAIIRDDMPDRALYDTGFTINVLRGLGVAAIILLIAHPAAHFFHNRHFTAVVIVAAAVSALGGFENIGIVDFRRFIAFDQEFWLKLIPRVASVVTAISLAFLIHNFWALIVAILVNQCITLWLTYYMHPYRPRFTLAAWNRIASYSTFLWLSNIVGLLQGLSTNVAVGRLIGVGAVGIYGVGAEIAGLPSSELIAPLTRAAFPGFAEVRKAEDKGGEMFLRVLGLMTMLTLPAAVGLSAVADPVVRLAFGNRWLAAIPVVQIAGIAEAFAIFAMVSRTMFAVHGWTKAILKLSLAVVAIQILLLIVLVPHYGLIGAVLASAVSGLLGQLSFFSVAAWRLSISLRNISRYLWRSLAACAIMAAILFFLHLGWSASPGSIGSLVQQLAEAISVGASIYIATLMAFWQITGRPNGPESDALALAWRALGFRAFR